MSPSSTRQQLPRRAPCFKNTPHIFWSELANLKILKWCLNHPHRFSSSNSAEILKHPILQVQWSLSISFRDLSKRCSSTTSPFPHPRETLDLQLQRLSCGLAKCIQVETFVDRAGSVVRINRHSDDIVAHFFCNPELPEVAWRTGFMDALLPESTWLKYSGIEA